MKPRFFLNKDINSLFFIFFIGLLSFSCNTGGSKKDDEKKDSTTVSDTASKVRYELINDAAAERIEDSLLQMKKIDPLDRKDETFDVKITAAQLDFLINTQWSGDPLVALKIRFHGQANKYSLRICGIDKDGDRTQYVDMDYARTGDPTYQPNPDKLKRNNQTLDFKDLRTFLGLGPAEPLTKFVDMYFTANPTEHHHRDARNVMYLHYSDRAPRIAKGPKLAVVPGDGDTNPCPPCQYCYPKCDDETIKTDTTKKK